MKTPLEKFPNINRSKHIYTSPGDVEAKVKKSDDSKIYKLSYSCKIS